MEDIDGLIHLVDEDLIRNVVIESVSPEDPVVVRDLSKSWTLIGAGNYAAVFSHENFDDYVVKIYAKTRSGLKEEIEVYKEIGDHPAYSKLIYYTEKYLILKRIRGNTLYNCFRRGIKVSPKIINDIDEALEYARNRGLHPHDVHVKNVAMLENRGVIVDISDFKHEEYCSLWDDFKKAYYKFYVPLLFRFTIPLPEFLMNLIRKGYRRYKKFKGHK